MNYRKIYFVISFFSLFIGGIYYLLFSSGTFLHSLLPTKLIYIFPIFNDISPIRFYFADFVWGFSLSAALHGLFIPNRRGSILIILVVSSLGLLYELAQYITIVIGTADPIDFLIYILAASAVTIIKPKENKK